MKKIKKHNKYILSIICVGIIIYSCLYNILNNNTVGILPDEIGYWSPVAMLKGYDWSSSMMVTPYYSFMYGIFLLPIYNLFGENTVIMYRCAIIFNTFMVIICFVCIYLFFKELYENVITHEMCLLCALFITCYPAYLLFAKVTLSESLLLCTTWLIIIEFIKFIKLKKLSTLMILGILSFIGYYSHQRFLVIIISLILSVTLFQILKGEIKRKEVGEIILILGIVLFFFMGGELFKASYKEWAYGQNMKGVASTNDYQSVINKFLALFKLSKIKDVVISLIGKLFYAGVATFGLVYSGLIFSIEYLYKSCKEKRYQNKFYVYSFLLFSFIGSVLLAVVVMNQVPVDGQRFDKLIYGRYSENLYGPIIAIALINMIKDYKKFVRVEGIAFIIQVVFMRIVQAVMIKNPSLTVQWLSCSALNEFFYNRLHDYEDTFYIIILRNGLILFVMWLLNYVSIKKCEKANKVCILILGVCIFLNSSVYTNENVHFEYKEFILKENLQNKEIIENSGKNNNIYCLKDKHITALQFIMPELHIECIESEESLPEGEILVTPSKYKARGDLYLLRKGKYLYIWKK